MNTIIGSSFSPYASPTPAIFPFHTLLSTPTLHFAQHPASIPTPLPVPDRIGEDCRRVIRKLSVLLVKLEWRGVEARKLRTAQEVYVDFAPIGDVVSRPTIATVLRPRSATSPPRLMKKPHDSVHSIQNGFPYHP
ncbi:hypothetical protein BDQ17DRAFT_1439424 [Cyathus striatus]|nr:hypothetical protein BDQ17DRAFT_1439424 [Cyathus striatus]